MSGRALPILAFLGPAAVLGAALFSQHVGGLLPCHMCIWQRWPHGVAMALALIAVLAGPGRAGGALLLLGAVSLVIGSGLGVFHAGVELGYWRGPSTCTGAPVADLSPAELVEQLMQAPLIRCDDIAWSFLGVSMAGWNAVLSAGLAALTFAAARRYASSSASQ
ncbi:disulfide bond formation protein B [Pikeienuella piscinae]|uniref:Disulfide bond formation protein B n=1 Tax=Pikeienuella piscinae TaxID=2748098 RepID=A0A7L5BSI5_9RHOB|nr:disulfide bond formation protein B [Pikeienuella piscinae]QIE53985.1 disulfide bond formation protein B [Pikeienuella piscinae]